MIIKKIHFEIDKTPKALVNKKYLLSKYKNFSVNNCDVIVVIGGDGFMLKTLKKFQNYNKPFYGMNRGTFGFLMNKFNIKNIYKSILLSKSLGITALEMIARTKNNINWMDIIRLAVNHAPHETLKVIKKINSQDKKISKLFKKIS